jgi:hypothetical protein
MPDISQITLPSGTTYNIKDAQARSAKGWIGVTTTALTDGATTNPITINGQSVTAVAGNITSYDEQELIFNGTVWQEFGDLSDLGTLAYKDSASGSYTPQGSVAAPDITVSPTTDTIKPVTDVGSMPTFTVSGETLIIGAGAVPTLGADKTFMTGASATASAPAFSGTPSTVTVS